MSTPASAAGVGALHLQCPADHEVGRLIKPAAHQPIYISLPGQAQEEWPREGDNERTAAYCSLCEKWFSANTRQLAAAMASLVEDELGHESSYRLKGGAA